MTRDDDTAMIARQLADLTRDVQEMANQLKTIRERAETQRERADTQQERIDLAARIGGKNVALAVIKRVPLMGGGVSAVMDGIATYQIGRYASGELVRRRALATN